MSGSEEGSLSSVSFEDKIESEVIHHSKQNSNINACISNLRTCNSTLNALLRWKSEPILKCSTEPAENISVQSEPIPKPYLSQNVSQQGSSEIGTAQNFLEAESEPSFGDLFNLKDSSRSQNHRDPVVVLWERSDKQENIENDIIVKFYLPGGEVFTQSFPKYSTVQEMKRVVSDMFKVPFSVLQLDQNSISLQDNLCVNEIALERFGCVTLQLSSLDSERYPLILNNVYPDLPTNDVLTVVVHTGEHVKEIIVEIENRAIVKPFLGGYRHKVTQLEYHHAFTQTAPKPSKVNTFSRNTQTPGLSKVVETTKQKCTQTSQCTNDLQEGRIIIGDPDRRLKKMEVESSMFEAKVLLIQRNLRSWLVRKMMMKMKEEYKRCILWEKQQKMKIEEEKEAKTRERDKAQTKPETRGHFELLYHNLEEWRKMETDRINNLGSIALRKSESFSVLEMEIQYINSIERQRIKLKAEKNRKEQEKLLESTSAPLRWRGENGQILLLDSLGTQQARCFKVLYDQLQKIHIPVEERIEILQTVKRAVLDKENSLASELLSLLDREKHILLRDMKNSNIDSLRERINYIFLEYIKDPNVNPEAKKYLPENKCQQLQTYKCLSCRNILPYNKFSLHSKANTFRKCHNCCWLREIGGPRVNVNPIRHILNAVRREELKQRSYTSVALIMQEQDFYHLIINIWLGHSAIGGSGNLEELRLGRWDFTQSWSPWNCILLTAAELKAHLRFPHPDQIYSSSFVKKIKQRHQMGRIYFSELAAYAIKRTPDSLRVSKMVQNFHSSKVLISKNISQICGED
ncbi:IQ and ubiquitin-like domain-containing protein [Frankliniella fusca]|uniref:IQ and ubiquitin-like domain-containing protein n=1 Tax=Frankliniella fusca TaxID=407009 RepID=A0AAE1GTV5_9NEOP|nr:IQ and ubiquitin-like domain-containing protein [Frankliniella fusca]